MHPRLLIPCLLTASLGVLAPAQRPADCMAAKTFESPEHGTLPYRLFTPEDAGKDGARLPLVLFLHGAGERGSDNEAQLRHGAGEFVAEGNQAKNPSFVAAPQCPAGKWWDVDQLLAFTEALIALPGVDPDRVYVTGLSMGGYATWHLIGRRPQLFAAAVPVCGGGEPETAKALVPVPIWAFHGARDRTVSKEESRKMIEAIRAAGGSPQYTEYPDLGHDCWTRTYRESAVHAWLFAQRRPGPSAIPPLRDGERIVFLGDSITEAGARKGGYLDLLGADLRARQPDLQVELIGAGVSGNRVPDLLARLQRDVLAQKPTRVVVYIGINDVWHHAQGGGTPKAEFEAGLRMLVRGIAAFGAHPVLCTPSVIGEKTDGSNRFDAMLDDYAAAARKVAVETGAQLLDLRLRFLAHLQAHNAVEAERGVLTSDSVHLNAAGNRLVADCMLEALGLQGPPAGK